MRALHPPNASGVANVQTRSVGLARLSDAPDPAIPFSIVPDIVSPQSMARFKVLAQIGHPLVPSKPNEQNPTKLAASMGGATPVRAPVQEQTSLRILWSLPLGLLTTRFLLP